MVVGIVVVVLVYGGSSCGCGRGACGDQMICGVVDPATYLGGNVAMAVVLLALVVGYRVEVTIQAITVAIVFRCGKQIILFAKAVNIHIFT